MADSDSGHTKLFVLALGLLAGFVGGFVILLSNLPVDSSLSDYRVTRAATTEKKDNNYEFYTVLENQTKPIAAVAAADTPKVVITPATRPVPGNALNLNNRNLASENYPEIQASAYGKESYFLQAGNFNAAADAERMRATVLLLGLEAFIVTRQDPAGQVGHRVRVGPFFDQNRLTEAKKRLRKGNVPYDIVRVTG
ncbi:MAG: SPOR domain-containing protein [Gammaproteobacteria bacterium]|nr:SPOR domain-containing protein [Gammaproteobacteria bacterium]